MKTRMIIGIIFLILFVPFVGFGIWAFVSDINSGNINFVVGPLLGTCPY